MKQQVRDLTMSNQLHELFADFLKKVHPETEQENISEETMKQCFDEFIELYGNEFLKNLYKGMYESVAEHRLWADEFTINLEKKWFRAFIACDALSVITDEILNDYIKQYESTPMPYRFVALKYITGRACQVYREIVCLARHGFADGAFARWRTLYELAVISSFIYKYGDEIAKSYYDAKNSDCGYHDWAISASCFAKRKANSHITFADIEQKTPLNTLPWIKQHKLSHKIVHAAPQGTFSRIGSQHSEERILTGVSDYGLNIPLNNAVISFVQICVTFLNLNVTSRNIFWIIAITDWIQIVEKEVYQCAYEIFGNEYKQAYEETKNLDFLTSE